VRVDDEISVLEVLDTAGQEDFVSMRSQWMMDKDGYIFVYSLLDKSSVRQLFAFVDLLSQVCDGFDQAPPVVFVGTKQDVVDRDGSKRVTTLEEVRYLIEAYEEASRALDRRSTAHHRASQHSGASNSGLDTSQPSISVGNVHDSFQSSGLLYEHSGLSTESMSPMGLPGKTIGLSPWMEKIHMETSALSGANIDHAFVTLTREVRKRRKESEQCAAKPQDKPKSWWSSSWCSIL
jgi:GTPase SAR1 family protein